MIGEMAMEHYYKSVPGWAAFADLYVRMVREAPSDRTSRFVEVGSWLGRSAALMGVEILNSGKPIELHCVDPWEDGGPDLRDTPYFKSLDRSPYELFVENTLPVASVIHPHRTTSVLAADLFADRSVDFIMIDGDHNYEPVKADIESWLPKMREGSIMSGDDALWPGVQRAVAEAFGTRADIKIIKHHKNYLNSASYWSVRL